MLPLQHRDGGSVSAQLIRHRVLFLEDPWKDILDNREKYLWSSLLASSIWFLVSQSAPLGRPRRR